MDSHVLSIRQLLADPVPFDGKRVVLTGWFVYEREHSAIYDRAEDAKLDPPVGAWLVHPATLGGEAAVKALSRSWVRVEGVFLNRKKAGGGHFNVWPAEITNLSQLIDAEPSSAPTLA